MNRQIIAILSFCIFTFIGCQTNTYKLEGTVAPANELDNLSIYLCEKEQGELVDFDSTFVKGNKFQFKGTVDSVRLVFLCTVNNRGEEYRTPLILEPGHMLCEMDSLGYMHLTGTKNNDILNEHLNEQIKLTQSIQDYYKKVRVEYASKWDSVQDSIIDVMQEMGKESKEINLKYIKKHLNTEAGIYIYLSSAYKFTVEEQEELISQMNEEIKNNPDIQELIKSVDFQKKTLPGQSYTDFTLMTHYGQDLALSELVGKTDYLLIDFWASWCTPCINFIPELKAFYAKNRGRKFDILGVSLDEDRDDWLGAIKKYELPWRQVSDLKSKSEAARLYAIKSIPYTILIDKNGTIVGRNLPLSEIQKILNK